MSQGGSRQPTVSRLFLLQTLTEALIKKDHIFRHCQKIGNMTADFVLIYISVARFLLQPLNKQLREILIQQPNFSEMTTNLS